jgi:hypothetical protein
MADQVSAPTFEELVAEAKRETRETLAADGEDVPESFDAMEELWESGAMQEMIESGDYSNLPDVVRPNTDIDESADES